MSEVLTASAEATAAEPPHPNLLQRGTRSHTPPASHKRNRESGASIPSEKRCAHCGENHPAAAFLRNERSADGLSSWCRTCHNEATRRWRAEHPERVAADNAARRRPRVELSCVECGAVFEGRAGQLVCGRRCKDARYRRLHPEAYRAKRARKNRRRREREAAA